MFLVKITSANLYPDWQGKAQAQMYQRTITEWERQRNRLEMEHGELLSRVDYLSDEVYFPPKRKIACSLNSFHRSYSRSDWG